MHLNTTFLLHFIQYRNRYMQEFRVTKYNPIFRNEDGSYKLDEWTSYSDVGSLVSLEEYLEVESSYINTAINFMKNSDVESLKIVGLEDSDEVSKLKNNETILISNIEKILKSILRDEFWCTLESKNGFIHFGYDYYMYLGVLNFDYSLKQNAEQNNLFVENFESPYKT